MNKLLWWLVDFKLHKEEESKCTVRQYFSSIKHQCLEKCLRREIKFTVQIFLIQFKVMLKTVSVQSFFPESLRPQNRVQFKDVMSLLISLITITKDFLRWKINCAEWKYFFIIVERWLGVKLEENENLYRNYRVTYSCCSLD